LAAASRKEVAEERGGMVGQPSNAGAGMLASAGGGVRAERTDSGLGALDRENQEQPESNAARMMKAAGRIVGLLLESLSGILSGGLEGGGTLSVVCTGKESGDGNGDEE
jgi:hypothetical protein